MAEAKKKVAVKLKSFVNNDDYDISGLHQGSYTNATMGTNPDEAWSKIAEWGGFDKVMPGHATHPAHNAGWQIPHNWLCYAMPELTGVSFAWVSKANYGDYMSYIYDPQYPMNPATGKAENVKNNPQTPFSGLKAVAWSLNKEVVNPETLEKEKKPANINENNILYAIISYKTKDDLKLFEKPLPGQAIPPLKSRFDFAMNMDYSTKMLEGNNSGEMYLCAQAANEVIFFCKVQEGIIILNWATTEYDGSPARCPVGSLRGFATQAYDFVNQLVEKEIISWADESIFN